MLRAIKLNPKHPDSIRVVGSVLKNIGLIQIEDIQLLADGSIEIVISNDQTSQQPS